MVGTITLAGGASENDVYAFQGAAGEYLTAEILSDSLRHRFANTIDSILRIYGPSGQLLHFYGQDAVNDDGLDSLDSVIQDVLLTEDGTYFVVVDTFASGAISDTDTGSYELFLYTYRPAQAGSTRLGGEGDELTGGGGPDVLIGSAGDDAFDGDALEDTFVGFNSGLDRVGPKNTAPEVVVEQARDVAEDGSLTFVAGNDADGDSFTATITQQPSHGSVSFDEQTGLLTYIPSANFNGADSFRYTLSDDLATSQEAVVSITVTPVNDAPVADPLSATTDEDVSVSGTLSGSDLDGDPLRFALAGTPVGGSVTIDWLTGAFTFTPAANFNGTASFSFTVSDGGLTSVEAQVTIAVTPVNDSPVANPLSIATDEDVAVSGTLTGTDVDVDALTFALVGVPAGGTVTSFNSATGAFIFTPAANFNGEASFAFTATDGTLTSPSAQVTINVTAVNDPPVATVSLNAAQPRTNDVLTATVTTSDVEGDAVSLTYEWRVNGELKRTVTTTALTDSFDLGQIGNGNKGETVTVTVIPNDGTATGASVSASAVVANSVPVAASHSFSTTSDAALAIGAPGLLVGAVDPDGDSLSVVSFSQPASGTLSVAADGSFIYTPAAAFDGTVSFEYTISDGETTATGTATIQVIAVNAVVLNAGDLLVYGTMGIDAISLIQSAEGISVTLNGTNYGPYAVTGTIRAFGRDGSDSILLDPTVLTPANLYGELGNDTLQGGSAADRLEGNDGDDLLMAVSGNDTLYGGLGNDTLVSGTDDDALYGEEGDDSLVATSGNDMLSGGSGSDSLTGGSGDDVLYGGEGNDSLNGGAGNDIVHAGGGDDALAGSCGRRLPRCRRGERLDERRRGSGHPRGWRGERLSARRFRSRSRDRRAGCRHSVRQCR